MLHTNTCAANSQLQHIAQAVDAVSVFQKTCVHTRVLVYMHLDLIFGGDSPPRTLG